MLDTQYLLDNLPKCFKSTARDYVAISNMRISKHANVDNFLKGLKNKIYENFQFHFEIACPIYLDTLPEKEDHEYIAISLQDFDNIKKGLGFFGALIIYRNDKYKLSVLYLPITFEKIVLKNERFYSYDAEGKAFNCSPKKRKCKNLGLDQYTPNLPNLIKNLNIPHDQVYILGSKIYILFLLLQNKIDLVFFESKDPIMDKFLIHLSENIQYQETGGILTLKLQNNSAVIKLKDNNYIVNLSINSNT